MALLATLAALLLGDVALGRTAQAAPPPPPQEPDLARDTLFPQLVDPPRRRFHLAHDGGGPNILVPALELVGINVVNWGIAKAAGKPYADISPDTWWRNLTKGPWSWDNDPFVSNGIAHSYQGALAFTAARSSGLGFWGSIPFAILTSVFWEEFMESLPPSYNDVIMTPLSGIVFGEMLHRLSLQVLDEGSPNALRWLVASLLSPVDGFNFFFFGRKTGDFFPHPPRFLHLYAGGTLAVSDHLDTAGVQTEVDYGPQLLLGLDFTSGLPGLGRWTLRQPFDHYVVNARLGLVRDFYFALFVRGLVAGTEFDAAGARGLFGLFAGYDFSNPNTARVATVSVGPGASAQVQLTPALALVPTVVLSGVPFGLAGKLPAFIDDRDYHYGPGAQLLAGLQFVWAGNGRLGADWRGYAISGDFFDEGWDLVSYVTVFSELALGGHHALGFSAFFADRASHFPGVPNTHEHVRLLNVYWTVFTGDAFDVFQR